MSERLSDNQYRLRILYAGCLQLAEGRLSTTGFASHMVYLAWLWGGP